MSVLLPHFCMLEVWMKEYKMPDQMMVNYYGSAKVGMGKRDEVVKSSGVIGDEMMMS